VVENIHVVDLVGKKIVIMDNASLYTVDWTTGEVNTIRTFFKKDSLARYDLDSDVEQPEYNPDADNSDEDQEEEEDDYSELSLVRSKFAKLIGNEVRSRAILHYRTPVTFILTTSTRYRLDTSSTVKKPSSCVLLIL
jgi:hypothetical protein